jgi:hypothetical protein
MVTRQESKKRKYDGILSDGVEPQPGDVESQSPETCAIPAKRQEFDVTSDNEEFDDGTDVEEDDEDENPLELSEDRYEVKDILDRRTLVCVVSHDHIFSELTRCYRMDMSSIWLNGRIMMHLNGCLQPGCGEPVFTARF